MNPTPIPLPIPDAGGSLDVDDFAAGFAPQCPDCLHTAEPWEVGRGAAWRCPGCDLALIG